MRHFSLIIMVTLLAAGCTKPNKGVDSSSGSSFFVKSVKNDGVTINIQTKARWQIPESATVTLQACLQARASHIDLYNQKFVIEKPGEKGAIPVETKNNACLTWDETIPYNHFAGQSGWVVLQRDIVGTGVYQGRQRVQIAFNPWAAEDHPRDGGCSPVVDMIDGQMTCTPNKMFAVEHSMHALAGELQGASRLIVHEVKINAIPEEESDKWVALRIEVNLKPRIQSVNGSGQNHYEDVQDGDFDVMMQLMNNNVGAAMNRRVLLLGGETRTTGRVVDGYLQAEFRVRQEQLVNQGNLELVMQIRPRSLNAFKSVRPFNGLFRLGPATVIKNQSGTIANECLENDDNCSYDKIVAQASNFEDLRKKGYVRDNSRYIFSTLKLRFTSILPGETATQRTVVYTAQTCITDNQTGRPLAYTPLVIRNVKHNDPGPNGEVVPDVEPDEIERSTDESGCLTWNGYNFHKYYQPEHFFPHEVIIEKGKKTTNVNGAIQDLPTFTRHLKFYINPWDDKFTFGWDQREFTDDFYKEVNERPKVASRFFMSDYGYKTVRFLYNIDQFMELEVRKWILMNLTPKVLRYSGIVNARKMVEPLRDGIYLMKVAIEKSYLDPRDNSGILLKNAPNFQAEINNITGRPARAKEYITTNMALVRVVDGVIVYPIELTMRDLRLMRVRANFMIELETVDERLIEAFNVLKKYGIQDQEIAEKLKDFAAQWRPGMTLDDVRKALNDPEGQKELNELEKKRNKLGQAPDLEAARKDLAVRVKHVQEMVKEALERLKARLNAGGNVGDMLTADHNDMAHPNGKDTGQPMVVPPGTQVTDNWEIRPDLLKELKTVLDKNDFSNMTLPKKEEIDLNVFLEKNTGLEKRTFVGPVIFLNNSYSDSMRATDNLDEANCVNPATGQDAVSGTMDELDLYYEANKEVVKSEASFFGNRQNNAYIYSPYFNSLTHLCYKHVQDVDHPGDDMMSKEKEINNANQDRLLASSLKYNFAYNYGLDAVSLTDEPLQRINPTCKDRAEACLEPAPDHVMKSAELDKLINDGLPQSLLWAEPPLSDLVDRVRGRARPTKGHFDPSDYLDLFYTKSPDSRVALCNLLANKISRDLQASKLGYVDAGMREVLMRECTGQNGLMHDIKLHVEQTGKYTFLGGLNLNFNVGEGFSVGTSSGWSGGLDITDLLGAGSSAVGGTFGKVAGLVLKPISLKWGTGLSQSEGTSISESTYLVSQIAGFDVELSKYERCAAVRLSDVAADRLGNKFDYGMLNKINMGIDYSNNDVKTIIKGGLFVCEGASKTQNPPITVPEAYFYFTQHFTEGDMLDQADLYNHPWLLSLRGMRDFVMFVQKIRAQEIVDLPEFLYHLTGTNTPRVKAWALEHLKEAYMTVMPTFPGFYTLLDNGEARVDSFALEQVGKRLSKVDTDPLHEVNHPTLMKENADRVHPPKVE